MKHPKTSQQFEELRQLWNDFDPIGVYQNTQNPERPDEYDSYHNSIIKHLNNGSGHEWIVKSVKRNLTVNMGLSWNSQLEKDTNEFVSKALAWFKKKQKK